MSYDRPIKNPLHTLYVINGFRSLLDFQIGLTPGLNILVGPNGSGKTNFIDFLGFLGDLLQQNASTAVSNAGGVAKVFSLENMKSNSPTLTAHISGLAEIRERVLRTRTKSETGFFNFEYDIEVKFDRISSAIYIASERLKIKKFRNLEETHIAHSVVGVVSLTRRSPSQDTSPKWHVGSRLLTENFRNPMRVQSPFSPAKTAKESLGYLNADVLAPDESMISSRRDVAAIEAIGYALRRGRTFNIIPARAREPDDLSRHPVIAPDGSGLSSTLHYLRAFEKSIPPHRRLWSRKASPESLAMVEDWTRLVFPQLQSITVQPDPHSGKYLVQLLVGESPAIKIPLQSASDGTVKWLALVCLLATAGGVYSIEEPENFLHPKMQQFLVQIIRDSLANDIQNGYFIMSTHSETLINSCDAREFILFDYEGNKTKCHRIRNPAVVETEINQTGFGLGYYYASNALS